MRDAKGNKDHLVPLPLATLTGLRRFWQLHRNPVLLFPHRHGGLKSVHLSTTPLDRGGVQAPLLVAIRQEGGQLPARYPETWVVDKP